jgi:phosphatidylinositol glycan class A protein
MVPLQQHLGPHDTITIVVVSRLFYNKGTDLLVAAIPRILASHPHVRFIIAGSGPKAIDLEQMLERNVLQDRVEMLGPVRHEEVRDVMVRGHIYLHPSLTEAFGTVIVEAASCGLYGVYASWGHPGSTSKSHDGICKARRR